MTANCSCSWHESVLVSSDSRHWQYFLGGYGMTSSRTVGSSCSAWLQGGLNNEKPSIYKMGVPVKLFYSGFETCFAPST